MKYPTIRFVFDRKKVASKTKKGLIQIEILSEGKRKWIGTGVKVYADQWDDRRKVINSTEMISLNECLDNQRQAIQNWINELIKKHESFEFDKLDRFLKFSIQTDKYIDYVEKRIQERKDIRENTRRTHSKLLNSLREFGQIVYFTDLTKKNIQLYDDWLHGKGYLQATVHSYHKTNKKYIHDAMREEIISKDPYEGLKIDRGKNPVRKYLTEEEVQKIIDAKIDTYSIEKVRDLFLVQCYTGLAYAELASFDFKKVIHRDGKHVIHDIRQKSGEDYYIVLLSPVMKILEKYNFVLPIISNAQYNMRLKVLADYAGIDKRLTSHMGRHTFACMCLNNGAKIENVSKMMGHTNINTTQI